MGIISHLALAAAVSAASALCLAQPAEKMPVHEWRSVEASNGAVYRVDLASVLRFTTAGNPVQGASVLMYADKGSSRDVQAQRIYAFDCQGHFIVPGDMAAPTYIPPRSVAAKVAALVCARHTSPVASVGDLPKDYGRRPTEYCVGFSLDACERMKAVIESKKLPAVCKPGFAIVGDPANKGLDAEQLRICYVMMSTQ